MRALDFQSRRGKPSGQYERTDMLTGAVSGVPVRQGRPARAPWSVDASREGQTTGQASIDIPK